MPFGMPEPADWWSAMLSPLTAKPPEEKTPQRFLTGKKFLRSFIPPEIEWLSHYVRIRVMDGTARPIIALADGADPEVIAAAFAMATFGLAEFKLFATETELERIRPNINAILADPINEPFLGALGSKLGVHYDWERTHAFPSIAALLAEFERHHIEVIDPSSVIGGNVENWAGFRDALIEELKRSASTSKSGWSEKDYEDLADAMVSTVPGFAIAAAVIGWRGITNAVGGKQFPTATIASHAKNVLCGPGKRITSYAVVYRVIPETQPKMLFMTDPGVIPEPTIEDRLCAMLAMAQMIEDWIIVRQSLGEVFNPARKYWIGALSFSTGGSADHRFLHGQDTVAEQAARMAQAIWERRGYRTGLVEIMPYECQFDAGVILTNGHPSKLKSEEGGGNVAGLTCADLNVGNSVLKALALSITSHGGGPMFLRINPKDPGDYSFMPVTDLSRSDTCLRIFAAFLEAIVRPLIRKEAERILMEKKAA